MGCNPNHIGHDWSRCPGWDLSDPALVPFHPCQQSARDVYRTGFADRRRYFLSHDTGRAVPSAWRLSRRCGSCQLRIPARIGKRSDTFQGPAAGALFHHRWCGHQLQTLFSQSGRPAWLGSTCHCRQGADPVLCGPRLWPPTAQSLALYPQLGPGRRIWFCVACVFPTTGCDPRGSG